MDGSWQAEKLRELKLNPKHRPLSFETDSLTVQAMITAKPTEVKSIRGDGNCFFRAISYHLYGKEDEHKVIRSSKYCL